MKISRKFCNYRGNGYLAGVPFISSVKILREFFWYVEWDGIPIYFFEVFSIKTTKDIARHSFGILLVTIFFPEYSQKEAKFLLYCYSVRACIPTCSSTNISGSYAPKVLSIFLAEYSFGISPEILLLISQELLLESIPGVSQEFLKDFFK